MEADGVGLLTRRVWELGRDLASRLNPTDALAVGAACAQLGSPLEVGVAGRVNCGKSTLVNALVGRRIAPTDARECTRLVTAFEYGELEGISLLLADGDRLELPLSHGQLPETLPVENERIRRVEVRLQNRFLHDLTVIDTPGLASTNEDNSDRTVELLVPTESDPDSSHALSRAEAIVYVYTQSVRRDDQEMLHAFRHASAAFASHPGNALGILNKVDLLSAGDPLATGRNLAQEHSELFSWEVSSIVPVVGLLAETVETGRWNEHLGSLVAQLGRVDDAQLSRSLQATGLFMRQGEPVSQYDRAELLERLGLHGVRLTIDASRRGQSTAATLARTLMAASGFGDVRSSIDGVFRARADSIKAAMALHRMEEVAARSSDAETKGYIGDAIEELLSRREFHRLRELEVLALITSGRIGLPEGWLDEAIRLINGFSPGEKLGMREASRAVLIEAARDASKRWRIYAVTSASPQQEEVASAVHRSYFYLWSELQDTREAPGD